MKQTAINYGKVLFELGISEDAVETAKQLYLQSEELRKVLNQSDRDPCSKASDY